jgi:hypothetical protein
LSRADGAAERAGARATTLSDGTKNGTALMKTVADRTETGAGDATKSSAHVATAFAGT